MTIIEGVGDEVVYLVVALALILATLAWASAGLLELPGLGLVNDAFQHLFQRFRQDNVDVPSTSAYNRSTTVVQSSDQVRTSSDNAAEENVLSEHDTNTLTDRQDENDSSQTPSAVETQEICTNEAQANVLLNSASSLTDTELRQRRLNVLGRANAVKACASVTNAGELGAIGSAEVITGTVADRVSNDSSESRRQSASDNASAVLQDTEPPPGCIRIKLKYLDERQRFVFASLDETVGAFKRKHFAEELARRLTVRFIFNGHELKHEAATLRSCGVQSESVIHCLLAAARQEPTAATNSAADAEIQAVNVGALMLPMFAVILGLLWYCRFAYRGYFNAMSTLILVGMTLLFSMGVLSAIHRRQPGHEHAA